MTFPMQRRMLAIAAMPLFQALDIDRVLFPMQATQPAGSQKRQRKGPSWADDVVPPADDSEKTIFDDWDDYVKV